MSKKFSYSHKEKETAASKWVVTAEVKFASVFTGLEIKNAMKAESWLK